MTPVLFPDHQTRLSSREKSGGRYGVHAGSPFGGGTIAPVAIMHHKFIVRSLKARLQIARTYDKFSPGYGTGQMIPFQAPEIAYFGQEITLCDAGTGMVPWTPMWSQQENIHEVTVIK
jgi:hypothetical protein